MFSKIKIWYLIAIAIIIYVCMPSYVTKDNIDYYGSMLCTITGDHFDIKDDALKGTLQKITEGTNADYALQKHYYDHGAGERVLSLWSKLSPDEKTKARQDKSYCLSLMQRGQGFGW